jgi:beta-glucosidase-like glycosyl hydrolase
MSGRSDRLPAYFLPTAALSRLVRAGAISMADVDRGAARVLELKRRHGLLPVPKGTTR